MTDRWICIWRDGDGANAHEGAAVYRTEVEARKRGREVAIEDDVTLIACAPVRLRRQQKKA